MARPRAKHTSREEKENERRNTTYKVRERKVSSVSDAVGGVDVAEDCVEEETVAVIGNSVSEAVVEAGRVQEVRVPKEVPRCRTVAEPGQKSCIGTCRLSG